MPARTTQLLELRSVQMAQDAMRRLVNSALVLGKG